jgi:hypothetical protein
LSALHHLGSTYPDSASEIRRAGRHLYDVTCLLEHEATVSALEERAGFVEELAADVARNASLAGWKFTPRPEAGFGASPVFDSYHACHADLREGYEAIQTLIYGQAPSFEACLRTVAAKACLI